MKNKDPQTYDLEKAWDVTTTALEEASPELRGDVLVAIAKLLKDQTDCDGDSEGFYPNEAANVDFSIAEELWGGEAAFLDHAGLGDYLKKCEETEA